MLKIRLLLLGVQDSFYQVSIQLIAAIIVHLWRLSYHYIHCTSLYRGCWVQRGRYMWVRKRKKFSTRSAHLRYSIVAWSPWRFAFLNTSQLYCW